MVSVDLKIPDGTSELDPLQCEGAGALLQNMFGSAEGVDGPDGMMIPLEDFLVAVYPRGAILKVFVDAPALEFAEAAVQGLCLELLDHSELLSEWMVDQCEVQLHPELAQESLAAADGPEAPPSDLEARRAQHRRSPAESHPQRPTSGETEQMRRTIRALGPKLTLFDSEAFGVGDEEPCVTAEDAELAAGAVVYAIDLLVDELFQDLHALNEIRTNADEPEGVFWILDGLPERFAPQYDNSFLRRFFVATVAMTARFTSTGPPVLSCIAEELALRLLLERARFTLDLYGLLNDGASSALDFFADGVYEDMDHEWLYDGEMSDMGSAFFGTEVESWFAPFNQNRYVHPYTRSEGEKSE